MKLSNANIKYYDTLNFDISCMIFHQEYYIFVTFSIKSPDQSTNENQKKKKKFHARRKNNARNTDPRQARIAGPLFSNGTSRNQGNAGDGVGGTILYLT